MRIALAAVLLFALTSPVFADDAPAYFCKPGQRCWPTDAEWRDLGHQLTGELIPRPAAPVGKPTGPFAVQDSPGGTESLGWLDAWTAAPSAYAVKVATARDIAAAVDFARAHRLRVVVKGTGHDYLGRSSAPDSLLIWTHAMRAITVADAFTPTGCTSAAPVPAVTLDAGVRWLEAYQEVTGKHGRYVQGGGCTSVGAVGGFLQGGGFGSWSNKYGIAAASALEFEVVTAAGKIVVASSCQNADLFWALRGGGGGTFGIVTKATLRTWDLPATFGRVAGTITAKTDRDYAELLEHFVAFYRDHLADEHWGESVVLHADNTLDIALASQGLSTADENRIWQPLRAWLDANPQRFTVKLDAFAFPAPNMWSWEFFTRVKAPIAGDAAHWWWAGNEEELGVTWAAYQSRWITRDHFAGAAAKQLAAALFAASREWTLSLHFNKGQAAASTDARARDQDTAMNPQVLDAAALMITGAAGDGGDRAKLAHDRAQVAAAAAKIAAATPGAGSYVNETDYFEPDWQRAFWGASYARLLAIKHTWDPTNVFYCHHCVGSEEALAQPAP